MNTHANQGGKLDTPYINKINSRKVYEDKKKWLEAQMPHYVNRKTINKQEDQRTDS
jgi:hypothetical protein